MPTTMLVIERPQQADVEYVCVTVIKAKRERSGERLAVAARADTIWEKGELNGGVMDLLQPMQCVIFVYQEKRRALVVVLQKRGV
jgi:hypothetical protein